MKKKKKIITISEQLNERIVRGNLWYYNDDIKKSYSPKQEEVDSGKLVSYKKITKEKYENFTPRSPGRNKLKREVSFVVDWQLSDSL